MILRDRGGVFPQGSPEHFVKVFFFVQTLSVLAWASQRELAHLKATFSSEVRFAVRSSSSFSDLFFLRDVTQE